MFGTVKSLRAAVATLTSDMKHMMETIGQSNDKTIKPNESEALRLTVREEVKELEGRESKGTVRYL